VDRNGIPTGNAWCTPHRGKVCLGPGGGRGYSMAGGRFVFLGVFFQGGENGPGGTFFFVGRKKHPPNPPSAGKKKPTGGAGQEIRGESGRRRFGRRSSPGRSRAPAGEKKAGATHLVPALGRFPEGRPFGGAIAPGRGKPFRGTKTGVNFRNSGRGNPRKVPWPPSGTTTGGWSRSFPPPPPGKKKKKRSRETWTREKDGVSQRGTRPPNRHVRPL